MKKILLSLCLLINVALNLNSTVGKNCVYDAECDTDEGETCELPTGTGGPAIGRCIKK